MTIQPTYFENLPKYFEETLWCFICSTQCEHSNFHLNRDDAELEVEEYLTAEAKEVFDVEQDSFITEVYYTCYIMENDTGIFIEEHLEDLPTRSDDQIIYKVDGEFYQIDMGSLYEIQEKMNKRHSLQEKNGALKSTFGNSEGASL